METSSITAQAHMLPFYFWVWIYFPYSCPCMACMAPWMQQFSLMWPFAWHHAKMLKKLKSMRMLFFTFHNMLLPFKRAFRNSQSALKPGFSVLWIAPSVRIHFLLISMKQSSHLMANSGRFQTSHWLWLGFSVQISFWFSPPPCVCLDQSSVWINHSIKRVANQGPSSP